MYFITKSPKSSQQFNRIIITMGVFNENNKLVVITEAKPIHSDLPKELGNKFKHETGLLLNTMNF